MCLALVLRAWPASAAPALDEYQVKSAFLLNLARFVEWPRDAFAAPSTPVTFCVVGTDPFGTALDTALDGRLVGGHKVALKRLPSIDAAVAGCHVAFVARKAAGSLSQFDGLPVLTVSDADGFAAAGGMIGLFIEDQRVRFEVNLAAAERSHLKISSRVLALASSVNPRPQGLP